MPAGARGGGTETLLDGRVVCPPGFEDLVAAELEALGVGARGRDAGGVFFSGQWPDVWRINLWSRVASRVLVRVAEFDAAGFAELRRGVRRVDWEQWLPGGCPLGIRVAKARTRLYHTAKVADEVLEVLAQRQGISAPDAGPARATLYVRIAGRRVTLSLDTSGAHLHRRGYRLERARAPMRENLAAALIGRAGWAGREAFLDPLCGSGTLAVEAALLGMGRAPGLGRSFAFEELPSFRSDDWTRLRGEAARAARATLPAPVFAADREPEAVRSAARAIRRAGLADHVQVACCDLEELEAPAASGLLMANPPYGKRLGGAGPALGALGRALEGRFRRWRWAVVLPTTCAPWSGGDHGAQAFSNGGVRRWFAVGGPRDARGGTRGEVT